MGPFKSVLYSSTFGTGEWVSEWGWLVVPGIGKNVRLTPKLWILFLSILHSKHLKSVVEWCSSIKIRTDAAKVSDQHTWKECLAQDLVFVRLQILIINPPSRLLPHYLRQQIHICLAWPAVIWWSLVATNGYKGHHRLPTSNSRCEDSFSRYCRVYKGRLELEGGDVWLGPQKLYSGAGLCEVVILISVTPVQFDVVDEPFYCHCKTVKANSTVCCEVGWNGEFHFVVRRGSNLIQKINVYGMTNVTNNIWPSIYQKTSTMTETLCDMQLNCGWNTCPTQFCFSSVFCRVAWAERTVLMHRGYGSLPILVSKMRNNKKHEKQLLELFFVFLAAEFEFSSLHQLRCRHLMSFAVHAEIRHNK